MTIEIEDIKRLKKLYDLIETNQANEFDYNEYQALLEKYGIDSNKITSLLTTNNIHGWPDYINQRKNPRNFAIRRATESLIAGTLVGMGLGLLIKEVSRRK